MVYRYLQCLSVPEMPLILPVDLMWMFDPKKNSPQFCCLRQVKRKNLENVSVRALGLFKCRVSSDTQEGKIQKV